VISLVSQMSAFVVMVATGFMVGLMFDIYRVIRTITRPRAKGSFIMDLLFWLWVTPVIFIMLLMGNWGELRLYVFLGAALGLFFYFQLVSAKALWALLAFTRWLGSLVVKTLRVTALIMSMPVQLMRKLKLALKHSCWSLQQWVRRCLCKVFRGIRLPWLPQRRSRFGDSIRAIRAIRTMLPWGKTWPFSRR
jgi:spore cortex biosynthesis protein YabQ